MTNNKEVPGSEGRWLAFVTNLPVDDPGSRMRVLRTLESLGAAVLREGVFLLPDNPTTRQSLTRLAEHVGRFNGTSDLLVLSAQDAVQNERFLALFDRTGQYENLIKSVEGLRAAFGISDPRSIARVLAKLRRDLEAIRGLDFFPSAIQAKAQDAVRAAEKDVFALMFPDGPKSGSREIALPEYRGRKWATRTPLWTDRLASAWLIRRFIDSDAAFIWLDKSDECPPSAISFGFEGAEFANSSNHVTFETLLSAFGLETDATLAKVSSLIRNLEVPQPTVSEAAGVQTLLEGARRRCENNDDLLSESEKTFDLLYEAYSDPVRQL